MQAWVSFGRMDDLLSMEEMKLYYEKPKDNNTAVAFSNYHGAWHVIEKGEVKTFL